MNKIRFAFGRYFLKALAVFGFMLYAAQEFESGKSTISIITSLIMFWVLVFVGGFIGALLDTMYEIYRNSKKENQNEK